MTNSNSQTGARRRSANDAWSVSSSVEWLGAGNVGLGRTPTTADAPQGAVKAKVHYRYRGKSKKPTFSGPDLVQQVTAFQAHLAAAHANNWAADERGWPMAPAPLPSARVPSTNDANPAVAVPALRLPEGKPDEAERRDVQWLVGWIKSRHDARPKKRGGRRSSTTNGGYANELDFFLSLARYDAGDPRAKHPDAQPGTPWLVDDPRLRVCAQDLLKMLDIRAATNLRTRRSNQVAMEKWGAAVRRERARAAADRRQPCLPEPPKLASEEASARTIESFARTVREMFHDAFAHGLIDYQPWTAAVEDEVPTAGSTTYSTNKVPSRDQVEIIRQSISEVVLTARVLSGRRESCSGDRYAALVWLAGREAPRPEESIAIRDSWVILDDDDPRIVLQWAEVYHPQPDGGRIRAQVPLKHRQPDEVRVLRPHKADAAEFVRVLSEHRRRFVTKVDPTTLEPDKDDPYFFTNHSGHPIELSNFGRWWDAALSKLPAESRAPVLDGLPFRRLRAAAITDWLAVRHFSTDQAAHKAGNTQQVIERHYKGVLDARPDAGSPSVEAARPTVPDLGNLSGAELGDLLERAQAEIRLRWG